MTAETDLLPLPDWMECLGEVSAADIRDYARDNVARATALLRAEIEALRAEVERANSWNERVSVCRDHVADIVDGPCVICALDAAEARAERLAEALRKIEAIEDEMEGGDWDEIEAARKIATAALHPDAAQEEGK